VVSCDERIFLIWKEPLDADGIANYEVSLDVEIDRQWQNLFVQQVDAKTTQVNISKYVFINCNHSFEWRVRAMDTLGVWSDWSPVAVFQAVNTPPPAPILNVKPEQISCNSSAQLTWTTPRDTSGIRNYRLQLYVLQDNQWVLLVDQELGNQNSFDISAEASKYCGYKFNARVVVQDNHGDWGAWSPMLDFSIDFPVPG
jgi:hypothetical protein